MTVDLPPLIPDWLPVELMHVTYELARVDQLVWQLFETVIDFGDDIVEIEQRQIGDGQHQVYVKSVAEVPPLISLLFSEAINHLRSALEHTLFGVVELQSGAALPERTAKKVQFPVSSSAGMFKQWCNTVRGVPGLAASDPLRQRVESLQPFVDVGTQLATHPPIFGQPPHDHPLTLLQAYSNIDKHRRVHAAASQELGINPGFQDPTGIPVISPPRGPYEAGKVIHTGHEPHYAWTCARRL